MTNPLRQLPSVDRLLSHPDSEQLILDYGRELTVEAIRVVLDNTRKGLVNGDASSSPEDAHLLDNTRQMLDDWTTPSLRPVINATGVIIHTNLGRAPLSEAALSAVSQIGKNYSTLEYDVETGARGSREVHAEELLRRLTGAEAALVVNNNAAATLLALTALAGSNPDHPAGRGVIVSRGELVEIGGGFRMPDVMLQSGAQMVEVGTTNRTHLRDYQSAIDESAAMIVHVHRSNFAIVGFTIEPSLSDLASLAHENDLLAGDDLGSGALLDTATFGLAHEPTVAESLEAGMDVVWFSGDKLLGGPQAGIIVGRQEIVEKLKRHPLARAVRADKMALAALTATLLHYVKGEALQTVPIWQMISASQQEIAHRAEQWADTLRSSGLDAEIVSGESTVGGGSLPGETLPTSLLVVNVNAPDDAAAKLRQNDPPVIVRIAEDRLLIDPRTVLPSAESNLLDALKRLS